MSCAAACPREHGQQFKSSNFPPDAVIAASEPWDEEKEGVGEGGGGALDKAR